MINILIADDESLARDRIKQILINSQSEIQVIGEAATGRQAIELIRKMKPDLALLDIEMPDFSGFDVVDVIGTDMPPVIFITAYNQYAIEAFEINAIDYILKPITAKRVEKSISRFLTENKEKYTYGSLKSILELNKSRFTKIPVSVKRETHFLELKNVIYFESDGNFSRAITHKKRYRTEFTLKRLEEKLHGQSFVRVHRTHIVNLNHIKVMEPWFSGRYKLTLSNSHEIDVSRRRVRQLKDMIDL